MKPISQKGRNKQLVALLTGFVVYIGSGLTAHFFLSPMPLDAFFIISTFVFAIAFILVWIRSSTTKND